MLFLPAYLLTGPRSAVIVCYCRLCSDEHQKRKRKVSSGFSVDKLALIAPYFVFASVLIVATALIAVYLRRAKSAKTSDQ